MNFKTLQLDFDSAVATITLNRPDKRNAISYEPVSYTHLTLPTTPYV